MRFAVRRFWIGVLACAFVAGACGSDEKNGQPPPGPHEDGSFRLIDFGAIAVSSNSVHPVEIRNVGSAAARYEVRGLSAPFEVEPNDGFVLPVGTSRTIEFSFAPTSAGEFDSRASVVSATGEIPVRLLGKAVVPRFTCPPGEVDFGGVERYGISRAEVTCTNQTDAPLPLAAGPVEGDHPAQFRYTLASGLEIPPAATVRIPVSFENAEGGIGPRSASFTLYSAGTQVQTITLHARSIGSALELPTGCLDFGHVPPGLEMVKELHVRSVTSRQVIIDGLEVTSGDDYQIVSGTPIHLHPDDPTTPDVREDETRILVQFAPRTVGDAPGVLQIRTGSAVAEMALCGAGGGPQLACSASSLDFGPVAVGVPRSEEIVCTNAGSTAGDDAAGGRLVIESVTTGGELFSAYIVNGDGSVGPKETGYAAGDTFRIALTYDPSATSLDTATLRIRTNDALAPEQNIALHGEGRSLEPCELALSQQAIGFGLVAPGDSLELALELRNQAAHDCIVRDVEVATDDGGSGFSASLPGGAAVLPGGGRMLVPVTFTAPALAQGEASRTATGELRFSISDPARSERGVSLQATVGSPCLVRLTDAVEFGVAMPGCTQRQGEVRLANACDATLEVTAIEVAEGGSCDTTSCPFSIEAGSPGNGTTLAPGAALTLVAAYAPGAIGADAGAIRVRLQGEPVPQLVPLRGVSSHDPTRTESFVQAARPKVDVLWVIDNSTCSLAEQDAMADLLSYFLATAVAEEVDWQIGIPSTDTRLGSPPEQHGGRLAPVDAPREQRILTPRTTNLEDQWAANVRLGHTGSATEKGILAARLALSPGMIDVSDHPDTLTPDDGNLGLLRPDAALAIVFASDEDDQDATPAADHLDFFRSIKGYRNGHLLQFHGIIADPGVGCPSSGAGGGDRYHELIEATGGVWQSWCSTDWARSMSAIGAGVFGGLDVGYPLGERPHCAGDCEDAIAVRIGDVSVPASSGAIRRWSYDAASNRVLFAPDQRPSPGSAVEITYEAACN